METFSEQIIEHPTRELIARPFDYNLPSISTDKPFILANTVAVSLDEIRQNHIIPVFIKDNETVISHVDFIDVMNDVVNDVYSHEVVYHILLKAE